METKSSACQEPSGRPLPGEYADYAQGDFDYVEGDDAVTVLEASEARTLTLLEPLTEKQVSGLSYAQGKWTLKEIVGHLADDERIFAYRALSLARGHEQALPGFDEDLYVEQAGFEQRRLDDLVEEYRSVRAASITLFTGLPDDAWLREGIVTDYKASVRGLAFHIAAHELHHLRILEERYLPLIR